MRIHSNGGSLPPRLPSLSVILRSLSHSPSLSSPPPIPSPNHENWTLLALSYRGYWTSTGRPSEPGLKADAAALLAWTAEHYPQASPLILWGQSLGAGVAVAAAVAAQQSEEALHEEGLARLKIIDALILETPFLSIRAMLTALYPQEWLPYRYLYPFLWNHWDSGWALSELSQSPGKRLPRILIVQGGEDEVVPRSHGEELECLCRDGGFDVSRVVVRGALHHDVLGKPQGRRAIVEFIRSTDREEG